MVAQALSHTLSVASANYTHESGPVSSKRNRFSRKKPPSGSQLKKTGKDFLLQIRVIGYRLDSRNLSLRDLGYFGGGSGRLGLLGLSESAFSRRHFQRSGWNGRIGFRGSRAGPWVGAGRGDRKGKKKVEKG